MKQELITIKKTFMPLILCFFIISISNICFAGPGSVQNLNCTSEHGSTAIQKYTIDMSWDYPDGYNVSTISNFYYAFNTSSGYTITTTDEKEKVLSLSKELQNSDNIAYYFHVAAMDNTVFPLPTLGPTTTYGPMRIDDVAPTGASISGPIKTERNYDIPLIFGATGATQMCVSNTGSGIGCTWEAVVAYKEWDLTDGYGQKTIFVQYKDNAGNVSNATTSMLFIQPRLAQALNVSIPTLNDYGIMILFFILAISAVILISSQGHKR
ncbi:conserved hypothetical protein, membrane [Candidatus Magnetomorum sp. HK-1]|nr:conserved hypothetical protein, membrane [Candidatus Magnetomorum sp. HK-1]